MRVGLLAGAAVVLAAVHGVTATAGQGTAAAAARIVRITVTDPVGDKMEYSRKQIVATPGERLRVQVFSMAQLPKNVMAHNWVLLKLGSDPKKFADVAALAKDTDFIPPTLRTQILAQTTLIGPGERAETTFTVPKAAGKYPYLCTFAGHYAAGMWGDLIVK